MSQASAGETRAELAGRFFPKNEYAKKISTIGTGNAFKTLSVTAFSDRQLSLFGDVCDRLNFAWARSMKEGKLSPVGLTRVEVNQFLQTFEWSWESDLEMQDQSHSAIHVAVFLQFVAMASDKLGHADLAREIRQRRNIADHGSTLAFSMGCGLGSGDPWTLVANCIMACSVLVSRFIIPPGLRMVQVGDDITCNMIPIKREKPLGGSEKVKTKECETRFKGNPSFTSFSKISEELSVPHRTRFIVKCGFTKRNMQQHEAWRAEFGNLQIACGMLGRSAVAAAIAGINRSDPFVIEYFLNQAWHVMSQTFDKIPKYLQSEQPAATISLYSRSWGCLGFALAHALPNNVDALNALNRYSQGVDVSTAMQACKELNVRYEYLGGIWSNRTPERVRDHYSKLNIFTPIIYLTDDHAACCKRFMSSSYVRRDRIRHEFTDFLNEDW
jgi:hypothetical protein